TEQFKSAACHLQLGELLQHQSFSLYDAMTAIEMMEPKMDSGMRLDREILHPQRSAGGPLMKLSDLTDAELLGVMDESLACLASWLDGESALQSVFINLYLQCIDKSAMSVIAAIRQGEIECQPLRTFCHGLLCLLQRAKDVITLANTTDEEDFNPLLYGFGGCRRPGRRRRANHLGVEGGGRRHRAAGEGGQLAAGHRLVQHRLRLLRSMGGGGSADLSDSALSVTSRCCNRYRRVLVSPAAAEAAAESSSPAGVGVFACASVAARPGGRAARPGRDDASAAEGRTASKAFELAGQPAPAAASFPRCVRVFERPAAVAYLASYQQLYTRLALVCGLSFGCPLLCPLLPPPACTAARPQQQQLHNYGINLGSPRSARLFGGTRLWSSCWRSVQAVLPIAAAEPISTRPCDSCQGQSASWPTASACSWAAPCSIRCAALFSRNRSRKREKLAACLDALWPLYESCYCLDRALFPNDECRSPVPPLPDILPVPLEPAVPAVRLQPAAVRAGTSYRRFTSCWATATCTSCWWELCRPTWPSSSSCSSLTNPYTKLSRQHHRYHQQVQTLYQHHLSMLRASNYLATATFYALAALHSDGKMQQLASPHQAGESSSFKHRYQPLITCYTNLQTMWDSRTTFNGELDDSELDEGQQRKPASTRPMCTPRPPESLRRPATPCLATVCIEDWDGEAMIKGGQDQHGGHEAASGRAPSGAPAPAELDFSVCPHYPVIKLLAPTAASSTAAAAAAPSSNGK
uniref:Protein MAK10 homolog n=1 Tax=Macrostomum lignano TaxID=282301 RepID=A0A1I8JPN9_9PLAT